MPGNTYKGSRNIKGKTTRKSSKNSSRRSSRNNSKNNSKINKEETFVEAILSDMPRPSTSLTKMDQAMGNRNQNGLINPQNLDYDPLHIQYMVQQKNDMSHLNKYAYSADQIMGGQQMMPQMGQQQMMPQMGQQQMMPQMGQQQMMPQMGQMEQPMMFGSRENDANVPAGDYEPAGEHEPAGDHEGQTGGGDLISLLGDRLRNNNLSSKQISQLRKFLQ
jgi:hypothetical protein